MLVVVWTAIGVDVEEIAFLHFFLCRGAGVLSGIYPILAMAVEGLLQKGTSRRIEQFGVFSLGRVDVWTLEFFGLIPGFVQQTEAPLRECSLTQLPGLSPESENTIL